MRLTDITKEGFDKTQWIDKGYLLPNFDIKAVRDKTFDKPTWIHFGGGNIFRAFPAVILQDLLNNGLYDRGVIVVGNYDTEMIESTYHKYDNLCLFVVLKSDGNASKRVIASITESLRADINFPKDMERLQDIFANPSLQMVSFTITEKGYAVREDDLERGLYPKGVIGKVAALLLKRFEAGAYPITLQSMDNCAHNGDVLRDAIYAYGKAWVESSVAPKEFLTYLQNEKLVAYPWSMIDKITPLPSPEVQHLLQADGFLDADIIKTKKGTLSSPFVNAEETEYLVMEDNYPGGRPPLDQGGVLFTDRNTVDLVEKMKVGTCLNPLHTAMAIFGCLLGYTKISDEMKDEDIVNLITKMAYNETIPVVKDPGIIKPVDFLEAVLKKRLPNPFIPDSPWRIVADTSQKLPIRFGQTIKEYLEQGMNVRDLTLIPLTFAAYARYLRGIDDTGKTFEPSSDPKLEELQSLVSNLKVTKESHDMSCLKMLFNREDVFGVNLYEVGLGEKVENMTAELYSGKGAVRKTLHKYGGIN